MEQLVGLLAEMLGAFVAPYAVYLLFVRKSGARYFAVKPVAVCAAIAVTALLLG